MMASTMSARAPFITLESGTTNPARRRGDIRVRRLMAVLLPVRCWIIALRLYGHCAWSINASTRSFLRVIEAGVPHKLRQPFKSNTRVVVINSPNNEMAEGNGPAGHRLEPVAARRMSSHATSQQNIIPVQVAFVRHAGAEASDINRMLCAQRVKHIIWQRLVITQVKVAFQNLR